MDAKKTQSFIDSVWDESILPTLHEYIKIPNVSPLFDKEWATNGFLDQAVKLAADWVRSRNIPGLEMEIVRLEGRTPLLYIEIPGKSDETILLYGHLDKQPPMLPWADGLDPYKPVVRDGKLYGRGGADDGYAVFGSLTAIEALEKQGLPHGRCVVIIECCEESGSPDLPAYIDHLKDRIGTPSLVVCLDSGCGNYDQFWVTTSLRGMISGNLTVDILTEGVHSGDASGVVPSSFRIMRQLLARLEDMETGKILPKDFYVEIPAERMKQAATAAAVLGTDLYSKFPFVDGMQPVSKNLTELLLNRTWRPQLAITGAEGLPSLATAGNVMRPGTSVKVSLRLPAHMDPDDATVRLKTLLESDPPYGAHVTFTPEQGAVGWDAPPLVPWLEESARVASEMFFGKEVCYMGEGGSIPFMGMLGDRFPRAQFIITGLLGPNSNAHGPNEFLEIQTGKRLTACISRVIFDHYNSGKS
ncbi:MAG: M20/M25/M40 family metallo-hydrolase [Acidobacteria bacterium]|nr:MAG: M20/M25/M40 family metallo-hydrolase [Acidobacteriota bacterium]